MENIVDKYICFIIKHFNLYKETIESLTDKFDILPL